MLDKSVKVDINRPKFDQSTYMGRFKHFFLVTNPLNLLASSAELDKAQRIVTAYRAGKEVTDIDTVEQLWRAKYLYDSAFHPETGEKSIIIGRMSAQMPMNTMITGAMLTFYKSTGATVFWQWFNQTYNATVNYTNRSGASTITNTELITSYCLATTGALTTALSLNSLTANMNPLIGRLVPLVAISAANCINLPIMRQKELRNGVNLMDENDNVVGVSKLAAIKGITAVIFSRISMAVPGMVLTPIIVEHLDRKGFWRKFPYLNAPFQVLFVGFTLIFSTPMGCAFFSQRASASVSSLEKDVQDEIRKKHPHLTTVYYNKGL